jgi:UDP-2,4-diacetamido-2,4,6-trideoxy-beta-L-altropyranose hydrolase
MHIIFRADASRAIGTGHVMRCLTLATALRDRSVRVSFVCREYEGHLCDLIAERGINVVRLWRPKDGDPAREPANYEALDDAWQFDAEETRAAIAANEMIPDWLVVDHYGLDHRWESFMRPFVRRVMVIDDLANRFHDCDLLLDQNLVARRHERYLGKIPPTSGLLAGPEYALLQPAYGEIHDRIPPRQGPIRRLFVFFGGADGGNLTGRTLAAIERLGRPDIAVDVVISAGSQHEAAIRRKIAALSNVVLYTNLPTLAPLMALADLAIGATGAASWERLCLGLPAIVVSLAENQRAIAEGLQEHGVVRWLGHVDVVDEFMIEHTLRAVLERPVAEQWSSRCAATVDGQGANRVCAALTTTADTPLTARAAVVVDERWLGEWASQYSPLDMTPWRREKFYRCLRDVSGCRSYVVENVDGAPVGYVRFERREQIWIASHVLAPQLRQCMLDGAVLDTALLQLRREETGVLLLDSEDVATDKQCVRRRISVCSDRGSWINPSVTTLFWEWAAQGHHLAWVHDAALLPEGDICFFLSYARIVDADVLARHTNNLVVHASDLPKGRGWSPLTWQILEGKNRIPVTLFEATNELDGGAIYKQLWMEFDGTELVDELRDAVARATQELCRYFVAGYASLGVSGVPQAGEPTFYARRRPHDSQLDVDRP